MGWYSLSSFNHLAPAWPEIPRPLLDTLEERILIGRVWESPPKLCRTRSLFYQVVLSVSHRQHVPILPCVMATRVLAVSPTGLGAPLGKEFCLRCPESVSSCRGGGTSSEGTSVLVIMKSSLSSHPSSRRDGYVGNDLWECLRVTFCPHELFLLSTGLWTSWGLLVTGGPMESPLGPQPIRSCSCSQKATGPCRSRSGPKVRGCLTPAGNVTMDVLTLRDHRGFLGTGG